MDCTHQFQTSPQTLVGFLFGEPPEPFCIHCGRTRSYLESQGIRSETENAFAAAHAFHEKTNSHAWRPGFFRRWRERCWCGARRSA